MRLLHWRGELDKATAKQRVNVALFLALLEVSAVLTGFSHHFISIPLYLSFLLPPLALTGLLLGPLGGTAVGLISGATLYLHAKLMPLHYFELLCVNPATSFVLLSFCGLAWGLLFHWVQRPGRSLKGRVASLIISCLLVSLVYVIAYDLPVIIADRNAPIPALSDATLADILGSAPHKDMSLAGIIASQALINAAYLVLICLAIHLAARRLLAFTEDINTRTAFKLFFIVVFFITYLFTITISFVNVSREEAHEAEVAMRSDVDYLHTQLDFLETRVSTFTDLMLSLSHTIKDNGLKYTDKQKEQIKSLVVPLDNVLEGYSMENEGTVLVLDFADGIGYSDDPRLPGMSVEHPNQIAMAPDLLGPDIMTAIKESVRTDQIKRILYHNALSAEGATDSYSHDMQLGYLLARTTGEGLTIVIIEPASMIFRDRPEVIGREVAISVILLGSTLGIIALLVDAMITRRIASTNAALTRITEGDLAARAEVVGTSELKSLATGINTTVDALNSWIREAETRMDSELAAARAIQESSLPREFPPLPDQTSFDICASMRAAREVGGDFYDFFLAKGIGSNGGDILIFLIADVSGKGVPAALLMMKTKTLIRESIMRHGEQDGGPVLETVNRQLAAENESFMFVTLWVAGIDLDTGELYYINAGHNPPLLCHDGTWQSLTKRSGLPLGMRKDGTYEVYTTKLSPGDRLVAYTDGVTEARNEARELYGDERLCETVEACESKEPHALVDAIATSVASFAEGTTQADDITVLALSYYG